MDNSVSNAALGQAIFFLTEIAILTVLVCTCGFVNLKNKWADNNNNNNNNNNNKGGPIAVAKGRLISHSHRE